MLGDIRNYKTNEIQYYTKIKATFARKRLKDVNYFINIYICFNFAQHGTMFYTMYVN